MKFLKFPNPIKVDKVESLLPEILFLAEELQKRPLSYIGQKEMAHRQIIKTAFSSAKIDGNLLTYSQAERLNIKTDELNTVEDQEKIKISNITKTLYTLHTLSDEISLDTFTFIHRQIMNQVGDHPDLLGIFREKSSKVTDEHGNTLYKTPESKEMMDMLNLLISKVGSSQNVETQLIAAIQSHYYFEKAHPFISGNGRVGRAVLQYQLQKTDLFANYIIPIDEYFNKNRAEYLRHLERNSRDIDSFIIFFLEGILITLKELLGDIYKYESTHNPDVPREIPKLSEVKLLPPRRKELFYIISDHPHISFENISRRFPTTPSRTIAYDVHWLVQNSYVIKHGETRGVVYSSKIE